MADCDVSNLRSGKGIDIAGIFSAARSADWQSVEQLIKATGLTDSAGAINAGDRRALYHLVEKLAPRSVLEIGTHVGGSTRVIALALKQLSRGDQPGRRLITVDLRDVNDSVEGAWRQAGLPRSPAEAARMLGCHANVTFVSSDSVAFMAECTERFDLVFLDGDHMESTVYEEIPAALRLLNPGGLILMHDLFPRLEPLWSRGAVIPGPWNAVERLRGEGAPLDLKPLGSLPWPTKLGSHMTSLALLARA
jgi:predicted O-methyltransferase YrrM